ncbi:hypothetical protein JXO59_13785 [candidate division KSB1 bacterium]|nr:hypothetical protein [candidate division KSB1 bacterium]
MSISSQALSHSEEKLFYQLKGDFFDELIINNMEEGSAEKEKHLWSLTEDSGKFYLDFYGRQYLDLSLNKIDLRNRLISTTKAGFIIRGCLGSKLGLNLDFYNSATKGTNQKRGSGLNFNPEKGLPINITGDNVYQDNALAYFVYEKKWLRFEVGRDKIFWGPGFRGGLSLSENMPPVELIRLNAEFDKLYFTFIHLSLRSGFGKKYLAGYRLDYLPNSNFHFAVTETMVYGNRDVDHNYLLPTIPLGAVEKIKNRKDTHAISLDLSTAPFPCVKLYGEILFYNILSTNQTDNSLSDQTAFTFGGHWVDPLAFSDTELRVEYTRVQPLVYAENDSTNKYTHYNNNIGYWLGANTDNIFLQMAHRFTRDILFSVSFEQTRKGKSVDKTISESLTESHSISFLSDAFQVQRSICLGINTQIRRDLFVSLSYKHTSYRRPYLNLLQIVPENLVLAELLLNY